MKVSPITSAKRSTAFASGRGRNLRLQTLPKLLFPFADEEEDDDDVDDDVDVDDVVPEDEFDEE